MELVTEPRYPMFSGCMTTFTIGYGLPLKDFLFAVDGKRVIITFGSPMKELVVDNLFVKVVLPEGSSEFSAFVPFHVKKWQETKISHWDFVGRLVVVLEKNNFVPDHNVHFQIQLETVSSKFLKEDGGKTQTVERKWHMRRKQHQNGLTKNFEQLLL